MRRGLLATREELAALSEKASRPPFDEMASRLNKRCTLILESAPIGEMQWQAMAVDGSHNAALISARAIQGRMLDLLISDAISENPAYRLRALEEWRGLMRWSRWLDPSSGSAAMDKCTVSASVAVVLGLDWLWDVISPDDRAAAVKLIEKRLLEPYLTMVDEDAWWYVCVDYYNAVMNSGVGLVALALGDESAIARAAYEKACIGLEQFFVNLGSEGGWDEGLSYWGYAMRYVLLFGHASARVLNDQRWIHQRGMDTTGLFPVYFSPNGHPAGFGETTAMPIHGSLYLLDQYHDRPELRWWLDRYAFVHDPSSMGWSRGGMSILFRKDEPEQTSPAMEETKVFGQVGWGAMADVWPEPTFYAALKTGDLAAGHSQRDMNALRLQVDGEMVLEDIAHRGPSVEDIESHQTEWHNTVMIGGEGHSPDAQGNIIGHGKEGALRWLIGDAGEALGMDVSHRRFAAMISNCPKLGQALVVLDVLDLPAQECVEVYWHAGARVEMDSEMSGRISGPSRSLHFAVAGTEPLDLAMSVHDLPNGKKDRFLRITGDMMDRACLVSIFARNDIPPIHLSANDSQVTVSAGPTLRFDLKGLTVKLEKGG